MSEHSIKVSIKGDNSDLKKKGEETKKIMKDLERGPSVATYKAVTKELVGIEKLAAKVGFNLSSAGKVLSKTLKETATQDVQKLISATDKYMKHAIQADEKIARAREANDQKALDRAIRQKSKFNQKMMQSSRDATTAQETADMLTPEDAAPKMGFKTKMLGAAVGAALVSAIQSAPQLYNGAYNIAGNVGSPQIGRRIGSYQGNNTDFLMEAKYGAMSKSYKRAKTGATLQQFSDYTTGIFRPAIEGALGGAALGALGGSIVPGAGTAAGAATGALWGGGAGLIRGLSSVVPMAYRDYFQGGRAERITQLGQQNLEAIKDNSILPHLYSHVLNTSGRNVNAMRGLNLNEKQLSSFTNMANTFGDLSQDESIGLAQSLKGTTGGAGAISATNLAGRMQQRFGYNASEIAGTVGNLQNYDTSGARGAEAAMNKTKAMGLNDNAVESAINAGAAQLAANTGGTSNTAAFTDLIGSGLSNTRDPIQLMREVQASMGAVSLRQAESNAGGIGDYMQTRISSKYAGGDVAKSLAIKQELQNDLAGITKGQNPTLAALGIGHDQQIKMAGELTKQQEQVNGGLIKGTALQKEIKRAAIAGQRVDLKTVQAKLNQEQNGFKARGKGGSILSTDAENKAVNQAVVDNQRNQDNSKAFQANNAILEGEQKQQIDTDTKLSANDIKKSTDIANTVNETLNPGDKDPTVLDGKALNKSLGAFITALDLAASRINSKFGRNAGAS